MMIQEQATKHQLQQDIADLQADKETWVKAGMLDKIPTCSSQPCVAVNEGAGPYHFTSGGPLDLRVLEGDSDDLKSGPRRASLPYLTVYDL